MLMNTGPPPHAGGIDQQNALVLPDQPAINGIARRSRSGVHNGALDSCQAVEQGRFAHIGPADNGQPEVRFGHRGGGIVLVRKGLNHGIQQIGNAPPVGGRNGKEDIETQGVEFVRGRLLLVAIDLIDRKKNRRVTPPQQINRLGIRRIHAFLAIKQKNNPVGFRNGQTRLLLHPSDDSLFFAQVDTAGIHQQKRAAPPFHLGKITIPRHARCIVHNGLAPATQTVEQRRLAHIRSPDQGNDRQAFGGGRVSGGIGSGFH